MNRATRTFTIATLVMLISLPGATSAAPSSSPGGTAGNLASTELAIREILVDLVADAGWRGYTGRVMGDETLGSGEKRIALDLYAKWLQGRLGMNKGKSKRARSERTRLQSRIRKVHQAMSTLGESGDSWLQDRSLLPVDIQERPATDGRIIPGYDFDGS